MTEWYQSLISSQKCVSEDTGPQRGVDYSVPYRPRSEWGKVIYGGFSQHTIEVFS